jgi:hypothetical protein
LPPNPQALDNTSGSRSAGIGGYHGKANVPYIFVLSSGGKVQPGANKDEIAI